MIENIKTIISEELVKSEISLAMIFNQSGDILWHSGRPILGRSVHEGHGYSKSLLRQVINKNQKSRCEESNVSFSILESQRVTDSIERLKVKKVIILPLSEDYYFYIDSGSKKSFSPQEMNTITFIGRLLSGLIEGIKIKSSDVGGISGISSGIESIRNQVLKFAIEEEPVLLLGETGVGKSYIAQLIHHFSGRKGKFFTINTPGIPETLFESELFGHKKGAFTDARQDKTGYISQAEGGTFFLDEISEVPLTTQAKLLRFIESKKYLEIGGCEEKEADVRIIAATNKDLSKAIASNEFRSDLYYRIQILEIKIPPLRERPEDIRILVEENIRYLRGKKLSDGFWQALEDYSWPGNIRELKTVLVRLGILAESPITGKDVLKILNPNSPDSTMATDTEKRHLILEQLRAGESFWQVIRKPYLDRDLNRDQVKEIIHYLLETNGHKYVNILRPLNVDEHDYKKFMDFLKDHQLK